MSARPGYVPTVHLNGTSEEELVRQRVAALGALRDAVQALREASPHMRDYYVGSGPAGFWQALLRRDQQVGALCRIQDELAKELEWIESEEGR